MFRDDSSTLLGARIRQFPAGIRFFSAGPIHAVGVQFQARQSSVHIRQMTKMHQKIQNEPAILRRPQVQERTGLSRSTLYQYIKDGGFPKPVQLGLRAVGWLESDISDWIAMRVKDSRSGSASAAR